MEWRGGCRFCMALSLLPACTLDSSGLGLGPTPEMSGTSEVGTSEATGTTAPSDGDATRGDGAPYTTDQPATTTTTQRSTTSGSRDDSTTTGSGDGRDATGTGSPGDGTTGTICGDGIVTPPETCDGRDLDGFECSSLGPDYEGTAECTEACSIDAELCCRTQDSPCDPNDHDCCRGCSLDVSLNLFRCE